MQAEGVASAALGLRPASVAVTPTRRSPIDGRQKPDVEVRREERYLRWRLRHRMRAVSRLDRVAGCATSAVEEVVPVYMREGAAGFGGIITCGSVWACAPCSAVVRQRRAEVVEDRARRWLAEGRGLLFVTLTMSHSMADELKDTLTAVTDAWKAVQQHRSVRERLASYGYVGPLRATEITHGYNGWHPHLHLLLWFEHDVSAHTREIEDAIASVWCDRVTASRERGVVAVAVGSAAVGEYLVKLQDGYEPRRWSAATEMTRADLKRGRSKHRTPFQIAEAAVGGDKKAVALWRVYESATRGRRCIQWGAKLLARLKIDEQTDEQLCAEPPGEVVMELSRAEWNALRSWRREAWFLAELERGGAEAAALVLRSTFLAIRSGRHRRAGPEFSEPVDDREQAA